MTNLLNNIQATNNYKTNNQPLKDSIEPQDFQGVKTKLFTSDSNPLKGLVQDGMTIMIGGFGLCGTPEFLIKLLVETGAKNLTIISNNCGTDDLGIGTLIRNLQVRKVVASYIGENETISQLIISNQIEAELVPQGTLAEKIRCGGSGIPAFYSPVGLGTVVASNKESRIIDGQTYLLEHSLKADISLVKAYAADIYGNLIYRYTARNFNPIIATAGQITICEAEEMLSHPLDPNIIHTPSIYVDHLTIAKYQKHFG